MTLIDFVENDSEEKLQNTNDSNMNDKSKSAIISKDIRIFLADIIYEF
jgi:hypothetical protein